MSSDKPKYRDANDTLGGLLGDMLAAKETDLRRDYNDEDLRDLNAIIRSYEILRDDEFADNGLFKANFQKAYEYMMPIYLEQNLGVSFPDYEPPDPLGN